MKNNFGQGAEKILFFHALKVPKTRNKPLFEEHAPPGAPVALAVVYNKMLAIYMLF
jgi:hypothetical protein